MSQTTSRKLTTFTHISLDGYYCDPQGDMSFAYKAPDDAEWNEFVNSNAGGDGALLLGRTTYDMMAGWWPTEEAAQAMPEVAAGMNAMPKVVFSRTLDSADWSNTTLVKDDMEEAVQRMKSESGPDMCILGSGSIVMQLGAAGLIDTFQVVVNPVALGGGKALFSGLTQMLPLVLKESRVFKNGAVVLTYLPG